MKGTRMKTSQTIRSMDITQYILEVITIINILIIQIEIVDSKYIILKKLGWGHFSTVWLALSLADK